MLAGFTACLFHLLKARVLPTFAIGSLTIMQASETFE